MAGTFCIGLASSPHRFWPTAPPHVVSSSGGAPRQLIQSMAAYDDFLVRSPDSKHLGITAGGQRTTGSSKRIAVMELSSGKLTYLTGDKIAPFWMLKGRPTTERRVQRRNTCLIFRSKLKSDIRCSGSSASPPARLRSFASPRIPTFPQYCSAQNLAGGFSCYKECKDNSSERLPKRARICVGRSFSALAEQNCIAKPICSCRARHLEHWP